MTLSIQSLASGSKGNSYAVETGSGIVIADLGISARRLVQKLEVMERRPVDVRGIVITHEHSDHISGIRVFASRYDIPVYANAVTMAYLERKGYLEGVRNRVLIPVSGDFSIGDLNINVFSISHDALSPVNYVFEHEGARSGIFTDLGVVTNLVRQKAKQCSYLYLEANHDLKMLRSGRYSPALQARIRSRHGHLSNDQALDLLEEILAEKELQGVSFIHLSEENNDPVLLRETVESRLEKISGTVNFEICSQNNTGIKNIILSERGN